VALAQTHDLRVLSYSLAVILTTLGCCIERLAPSESAERSLSNSVIIRTEPPQIWGTLRIGEFDLA
jgi:hypothetical protein